MGVTHHNIPARPDRHDAASFPHRGAHLTSLGTISRCSRDYRVKMAMAFAVMIDESRREVVVIDEPLGRPLIQGVADSVSGSVTGVTDSIAGAAEGVSASAIVWAGQVVPDVSAAVTGANPSM